MVKKFVVVGNGMTAHRFVEKVVKYRAEDHDDEEISVTVFGEEQYAAYDRVNLTKYVDECTSDELLMAEKGFYEENKIDVRTSSKIVSLNAKENTVTTESGEIESYDELVIATGGKPFVPPIPGHTGKGVFVYRTMDDIDDMKKYKEINKCNNCVVIGGGLLGLEAAKVCVDMGSENVTILEMFRLMAAQLDPAGSELLQSKVEEFGIKCMAGVNTEKINLNENGAVESMSVKGFDPLPCDLLIVACGVRPNDALVREVEEVECHPRGGILVDDGMTTSHANIHSIGECICHSTGVYGLVAPCYEMADILARKLTKHKEQKIFTRPDMSTKLKLAGVDVASFGSYSKKPEDDEGTKSIVYHDSFQGIYRRLVFNKEGTQLLGGILVGDASDYGTLLMKAKSTKPLKVQPAELLPPPSLQSSGGAAGGVEDLDDDAQVCSCNDVTKGEICASIKESNCTSVGDIGKCTKAGTGCGACKPMVKDILNHELASMGVTVTNYVCEHFNYSRTELYQIAKIKNIRYFEDLLKECGNVAPESALLNNKTVTGCEICKPTVASIMASLWNEHVLDTKLAPLQDTNDRFLANVQRGGTTYSVVPRVAAGEITPEKLIALGQIAKKYGLYTKITGGQRVDLFGAPRQNLPAIWKELVDAGFESGHAYGKALRTVKSCVGSSWCRYGMRDSVKFAIEIENRYRGIRAPHKLKGGVSGCLRECAEAQGKDFGLIATEHGYNIYLCGNGGSKPRHATLFASDVKEEDCIKYLDRFLIFYIQTADKLQRTARWLEKLEGGIEYLKDVIIKDKLGICEELEKQMSFLVDTYKCEWAEVVNDPIKQLQFTQVLDDPNKSAEEKLQVVSEEKRDPNYYGIEFVTERDQMRPAYWPRKQESYTKIEIKNIEVKESEEKSFTEKSWLHVCDVSDVPENGGKTIKYGNVQIAVFNATSRGEWYATQNMCPHRNALVLSGGILGDKQGEAKVSCPLHKKPFSLATGQSLDESGDKIITFPIKVEGDQVLLELPKTDILDNVLGTEKLVVKEGQFELDHKGSDCGSCTDEKLTW